MTFSPLYQYFFVFNFYREVNFCGKKFSVILFCGNLFLQIAKKSAKIAKISARKNLVPHGMSNIDERTSHIKHQE